LDKQGKLRNTALIAVALIAVVVAGYVIAKPASTAGTAACRDGIDNDGDGYTDYPGDPGCSSRNDNSELNPSVQCDDGIDNDGDGAADHNDAGCTGPSDNDESNCGDGVCEGVEVCGVCVSDCGQCNTTTTVATTTTVNATTTTQPNSCYDSDGGILPTVRGNVSGYLSGSYYYQLDFCMGNYSLMEYYCQNTTAMNTNETCLTNTTSYCFNGACA
jgi:hypothetical protein